MDKVGKGAVAKPFLGALLYSMIEFNTPFSGGEIRHQQTYK